MYRVLPLLPDDRGEPGDSGIAFLPKRRDGGGMITAPQAKDETGKARLVMKSQLRQRGAEQGVEGPRDPRACDPDFVTRGCAAW